MADFILIAFAYLLGSFPSALVIGKLFYHKDIRNYGSGNLGSTNAFRVLGKKGGSIVFFLDVFKGGLAVLLAMAFSIYLHPLVISIFALIGHIYPVFANFKGGKAVATAAGIVLFYSPVLFIVLLIIFIITLKIWKMVSLSTTIISIATIFFVWLNITSDYDLIAKIMFTLFAILIIVKHIPNYKRIRTGTENKVSF